jgi:hypothetical protein
MARSTHLIASTTYPIEINSKSTTIVLRFADGVDIDQIVNSINSGTSGNGLSLIFEKIKGYNIFPNVEVYLNLEKDDVPDEKSYVGSISLYGLKQSSAKSQGQAGSGHDKVFDVSKAFINFQGRPNWSTKVFRVSLVSSRPLPEKANLNIERVVLYYYEG